MSASPRTQPTEAHQTHGPGMHNVASPQTTHNDLRTSNDDADNALADARDDAAVLEYGYDFEVKEQDRWLPIANVARIMKGALPDNAKIAKDAKQCMQECVSEFISFITSEASEKCQQEKRKTVNGEDIIFAMTSLGFENFSEALKVYLARYRDDVAQKADTKGANPPDGGASDGSPNLSKEVEEEDDIAADAYVYRDENEFA